MSAYRNRPADAEPVGFEGVVDLSDSEWRRMMSINLDGTFYCVREALRLMIPRRTGAVVTVSSMAGMSGGLGISHYSASKAAVRVFAQSVAREVGGYGIRVNVVAPGPTDTAMLRRTPAASLAKAGNIPMGRQAKPEGIGRGHLLPIERRVQFHHRRNRQRQRWNVDGLRRLGAIEGSPADQALPAESGTGEPS